MERTAIQTSECACENSECPKVTKAPFSRKSASSSEESCARSPDAKRLVFCLLTCSSTSCDPDSDKLIRRRLETSVALRCTGFECRARETETRQTSRSACSGRKHVQTATCLR